MFAPSIAVAIANHEKAVRYQQDRVVNPDYRIADVIHPTKAEEWSAEKAEEYSATV